MNQKSLDKKKTEPKKLEWVNKIDFVDDWLEIDCEVIWGKKGVKTLIDFIQSLIQSTKEETRMECFDEQCELAEKQSKIASKAYNEGYSDCKKGRKKAPHDTRDGYCCACDYDLACFEGKLKEAKEETIREIEDEFVWTQNYENTDKQNTKKLNGDMYLHIEWKDWLKFKSLLKE